MMNTPGGNDHHEQAPAKLSFAEVDAFITAYKQTHPDCKVSIDEARFNAREANNIRFIKDPSGEIILLGLYRPYNNTANFQSKSKLTDLLELSSLKGNIGRSSVHNDRSLYERSFDDASNLAILGQRDDKLVNIQKEDRPSVQLGDSSRGFVPLEDSKRQFVQLGDSSRWPVTTPEDSERPSVQLGDSSRGFVPLEDSKRQFVQLGDSSREFKKQLDTEFEQKEAGHLTMDDLEKAMDVFLAQHPEMNKSQLIRFILQGSGIGTARRLSPETSPEIYEIIQRTKKQIDELDL